MNALFRKSALPVILLALAGCATQGKPPPTISLDEPVQAQPLPEPPAPVEVVAVPEPAAFWLMAGGLAVLALRWVMPAPPPPSMDGIEDVMAGDPHSGSVLVIGFGRFGQIASQSLLARGIDVVIIESDTDMIRAAAQFGFKVFYGDGTRLDVLHASGASHAKAILVCVDKKEVTSRIVALLKHECPLTPVLARAFDRQHAIELIRHGVDYQMRETFESALAFGAEALRVFGVEEEDIAEVAEDIRRRDAERLQLQMTGTPVSGVNLMHGQRWQPTPLTQPQREGRALNEEAADAIEQDGEPRAPAV